MKIVDHLYEIYLELSDLSVEDLKEALKDEDLSDFEKEQILHYADWIQTGLEE